MSCCASPIRDRTCSSTTPSTPRSTCLSTALDGCSSRTTAIQAMRSEEHTSELQSQSNIVCRLLLEKKKYTLLSLAPPNLSTGVRPRRRGRSPSWPAVIQHSSPYILLSNISRHIYWITARITISNHH